MKRLILGTAGHIDHGKTALVRALTGVDTDRLKEEKERGITIDLGFAELADEHVRLGIVDVPGHEGFIRNMLAGATGMDVVLLVVASDEGVMPQTREHLAIVRLLGVERVVVALTKCDLVEDAWLELVEDEVREVLAGSALAEAPVVATSARTGRGLEELAAALRNAAEGAPDGSADDLARLPVDRVFTVKGTGTVVTGTLWSGRLRTGAEVRLRPGERTARIRGLQVHGRDVDEALPGERTAVALTGSDIDRESVGRGDALVDLPAWPDTWMVTARIDVLPDTGWSLAHNQRIRVHAGTAEVMARAVVLEEGRSEIPPGGSAWVQLRLEAPVLVRARERLVLRSYSPVTTIAGGGVAEPVAPKRRHLEARERELLERVLSDGAAGALEAVLELAGWAGAVTAALPVHTGLPAPLVEEALGDLASRGALTVGGRTLAASRVREGEEALAERVAAFHRDEPLRPGVPLEMLRDALPADAPGGTADALLERLEKAGRIEPRGGVAADPGFRPTLTDEQRRVRERLVATYAEAGLAPPTVEDLPADLARRDDLWPLLRLMESEGVLTTLEDGLFADTAALTRASEEVRDAFGGRTGLGPTDFREVLPVSRRHLLPLLGWMDRNGVTVRRGEGRDVP